MEMKDIVEQWGIVLWASTARVLIDFVSNRKVTITTVLLQYICGTLCGYIAYKTLPTSEIKILYITAVTLLARDIVSFVISKEGREMVKDALFRFLNLKK